jgi:hypothetical protein
MGVIQLVVVLVCVGVLLWALNTIFGSFMDPWVLALVNKVALVAVVLFVLFWALGMVGLVPPVNWWGGPGQQRLGP